MPLTLPINGRDGYDYVKEEFVSVPSQTVVLEHCLNSLFKWEGIWKKPFLSKDNKTDAELRSYIQCMVVNEDEVDMNFIVCLSNSDLKQITNYITTSQTATTIRPVKKRKSGPIVNEVLTAELIFYYMGQAKIPFEPCSSWHLTRLMALLGVAAEKAEPPTKIPKSKWASQQRSLNAARRAKARSHG